MQSSADNHAVTSRDQADTLFPSTHLQTPADILEMRTCLSPEKHTGSNHSNWRSADVCQEPWWFDVRWGSSGHSN